MGKNDDLAVELPVTAKDKAAAVEEGVKKLQNELGEGKIRRLGSKSVVPVKVIPCGLASVDHGVMGCGGFPRGQISEVFGVEGGGKTTITLMTIAEAQAMNEQALFVDAEHRLDPVYAKKLGVDVNNLLISQPDSGEEAAQVLLDLVATGGIGIAVVDSVAAMVPQVELEGEMTDAVVGAQARLLSKLCRKLAGIARKTGTTVIFINQIREKIGVMYGNPETTTGGRALKFYSSMRIDVRRVGQAKKQGSVQVAHTVKFRNVKNSYAAPFRETEIDYIYEIPGFDKVAGLVDTAVDFEVISKEGNTHYFGKEKLGVGRDKTVEVVRGNEKLLEEIKKGFDLKRKEAVSALKAA